MSAFKQSLEQQHRDRLRNAIRALVPGTSELIHGPEPLDRIMAELEADDEFWNHACSCLPIGNRLELTGPMEQHVLTLARDIRLLHLGDSNDSTGATSDDRSEARELKNKAKVVAPIEVLAQSPDVISASFKLRSDLIEQGYQQALVDVWKIIGSGMGWANTYKLEELNAAWELHCKGLSEYWVMNG